MRTTLVVNAGSSSLKIKLLPHGDVVVVERIGGEATLRRGAHVLSTMRISRHDDALEHALAALRPEADLARVEVVGHRVVHGGERYSEAVVIDDAVVSAVEDLTPLAPLHNPANLEAIRAARRLVPDPPHVAVFDTAFHASLPPHAFLFGLPFDLYRDHGIRRYGFHGPSHDYVTRRGAELLGKPRDMLRMVSLHLGNGASAAAVDRGRCVDTTMGFTPLDGLLMGTRCGDLDPGVVLHLLRNGRSLDDVDELLNKRSGILGLSGVSNDMRDVHRAADDGNERARHALDVFGYRVRTSLGAFWAAMGGLDAVIFTGGIGENDARIRSTSLAGLGGLGIALDEQANLSQGPSVHAAESRVAIFVIPTDEEAMIATHANRAIA